MTTTTTGPEAALAEARARLEAKREELETKHAAEAEAISSGNMDFDFGEHANRCRTIEDEIATLEKEVRRAESVEATHRRAQAMKRCDELRGEVEAAGTDWHEAVAEVAPALAELEQAFQAIEATAESHFVALSALKRISQTIGAPKPKVAALPALSSVTVLREAAAAWVEEQRRFNR